MCGDCNTFMYLKEPLVAALQLPPGRWVGSITNIWESMSEPIVDKLFMAYGMPRIEPDNEHWYTQKQRFIKNGNTVELPYEYWKKYKNYKVNNSVTFYDISV